MPASIPFHSLVYYYDLADDWVGEDCFCVDFDEDCSLSDWNFVKGFACGYWELYHSWGWNRPERPASVVKHLNESWVDGISKSGWQVPESFKIGISSDNVSELFAIMERMYYGFRKYKTIAAVTGLVSAGCLFYRSFWGKPNSQSSIYKLKGHS
jgi:hypothetical protein